MKRKIVRGKLGWVKEETVKKEVNKKIKNATRVEVDGIKFRSKLEAFCYNQLKLNGLEAKYEEETFVLQEAFTYQDLDKEKKIRPITYTPDFTSKDFIIECKGFHNDVWPMKVKMFMRHLVDNNDKRMFFTVKNQGEIKKCITQILEYYEKLSSKNQDNSNITSDHKFPYWD